MAKKLNDSSSAKGAVPNKNDIINDYRIAYMSRQASLIGRKEVLTGKAKFGIFGDGKEVAQLAMAKAFKKGDWRSGYYRDQTFMFAIGELTVRQFFAQLYADANIDREPASGGRQMNNHFASRYIDSSGNWLDQTKAHNVSSDISPTGGQMARLLGLAYASKLYRQLPDLKKQNLFSHDGQEVAFGTIGNASTSEGIFWETMNAACVLQVPLVMSVWDDDYGISVPQKYHTTKESISKALDGFTKEQDGTGLHMYRVKGWDYQSLIQTYAQAVERSRSEHVPALIHVNEIAQPQGHSTSGSHERYKTKERLAYEDSIDCLPRFRSWIIEQNFANEKELDSLEKETLAFIRAENQAAWNDYLQPIQQKCADFKQVLNHLDSACTHSEIKACLDTIENAPTLSKKLLFSQASRLLLALRNENSEVTDELKNFLYQFRIEARAQYNNHLHVEGESSPLHVSGTIATYPEQDNWVDGRQVINEYFKILFARDPRVFALGEDVGHLGDVNLVFENIQNQFGELRCTDTGIREATILGQGIGAAMRGLRPIVDIQYLDYLLYCFQVMSDDLATLHYRTAGGQLAPAIVRTKGHRLEGIWHTGSPMGTIINGIRGMHVCVPRNMTQAAGMYETLMRGDDPALVIEVLNGYRLKEKLPANLGEFCVPLGVPEVLREGSGITLVTYGACVKIAEDAIHELEKTGISMELIDVQTLLPYDINGIIVDSIKKTNAVLFLDEDVPGGAAAYMMQQTLDHHGAYEYLDTQPLCLSAEAHRSPYASDGDYFCKPNAEDVIKKVFCILHERDAEKYPLFWLSHH